MDRRFLAILAAVVIIFAGIFMVSQRSNNGSSGSSASNAKPTNHIEGLGQKGVTLIEYGDYQCSVCEVYYQPVKVVAAQFSNDIYFQFRNLPLSPNPHPNAFAAARAAEAAGLQNKYWEMHDKLYEHQNDWAGSSNPQSLFNTYAQQIGADLNRFKQDYDSSAVNDAINADVTAFLDTSYANHDPMKKATPTFFLDGQYIDNNQLVDKTTGQVSIANFASLINAEIAKKHPAQ